MKRAPAKTVVLSLVLCLASVGVGIVTASPASSAEAARTDTGCEGHSDSVVRLYRAAFLRPAEQAGFDYWMATYTSGRMSLPEIAEFFSGSPELIELYGELTDADYVDRIYRNVLDRAPDAGGLAYWLNEMAGGMGRGTLLLRFTESPEFVAFTETAVPSDGYFGNGAPGSWQCTVDPAKVEEVTRAFAEAVADENTTLMSILAAEATILDPALPELELGSPAIYLDPAEPAYPWCEPIGDFAQDCSWFLVEGGDTTWTLRMIVTAEGIDFDGSGWTGRYVVSEHTLTKVA